jgi:hypothetical protein
MELDAVLKALERDDGESVRTAVTRAIELRESITPHLLEALRYAREHATELPQENWLHTWAMYLLAQFRETRAYPLIIELVDLPSDLLEGLHGDVITEGLGSILASVYDGDPRPLKRLIEKPSANQYVRTAALEALIAQVALGRSSREEMLEYMGSLFRTGVAPADSFFWTGLVSAATDLYPDLVMDEIRRAFELDLPDPFFMDLEYVEEVLARGKEAVLAELPGKREYTLIDDTLEATAWFAERPSYAPVPAPVARVFEKPAPANAYENALIWSSPKPVSVGPQPGRNDPCPCGSGLKYKKCCLKGTR